MTCSLLVRLSRPALLIAALVGLVWGLGLAAPARAAFPGANGLIEPGIQSVTPSLTIVKATDPAGGTGFPFTIDPGPYVFDRQFGTAGDAEGEFYFQWGLALDAAGNVYVADAYQYRIQKFDSAGNFLRMWGWGVQDGSNAFQICTSGCQVGIAGNGAGQFDTAHGVAVGSDGRVYVADSQNYRIQVFDSDGNYLTQWGGGHFVDLDFGPDGRLYATDFEGNAIQKFTANGTFLLAWGGLNQPVGLDVDNGGNVWVADYLNFQVKKFSAGGNLLDSWGSNGGGPGQFSWLYDVAVDAAGNVYTGDIDSSRIQKFSGDGDYLGDLVTAGSGPGQVFGPIALQASAGGGLFISDNFNNRIQVLRPERSFVLHDGQSETFLLPAGDYRAGELVPAGWEVSGIVCDGGDPVYDTAAVDLTLAGGDDVTCAFSNEPAPPPSDDVYVSTSTAGVTGDGVPFGPHDALVWDGSAWATWFDGSAAGLTPNGKAAHNVNAIWLPDPANATDAVMSFAQHARRVPGIPGKVDGMDLVWWDGSGFALWFDGQDVGLTVKSQEKIDALHVLDGSLSPIGGGCDHYLLISTQGPGVVPHHSGGSLRFSGEDVLGFCMLNSGNATAGVWHMVLDGSAEGMPRNSTASLSTSADGQTLYVTTRGAFNVDAATGGHSMVYEYDMAGGVFSGPTFVAADNGLSAFVDALQR